MCKQTDRIPDEAKGSEIVFPDLTQLGSALWTDERDCETPPVPGERGRLSNCLWNLGFFSERCTEKLPLRVDLIHRVEFGEVSGHRVLIKRGPGNRGPTECGTTHEATSGMSS